jgi:hypothetical protein
MRSLWLVGVADVTGTLYAVLYLYPAWGTKWYNQASLQRNTLTTDTSEHANLLLEETLVIGHVGDCIYLPLQSILPSTSQPPPLPRQQDRVLISVSNGSIYSNKMNSYLAVVEQRLEYPTRGRMKSKHVCTRCARQQRSSNSNC